MAEIFNQWPERYDQWFETPIGRLVKEYESKLVLELLRPGHGDRILDAGCGTGIFTLDLLSAGGRVVGLELSLPMLLRAARKSAGYPLDTVQGDMRSLPFAADVFDEAVSVTTIEFIDEAKQVVAELFRVTKPRGRIVVATLNSFSPWAARRKAAAEKGHTLFKHAIFRSPEELKALAPVEGEIRTAIHFQKDDDPEQATTIEENGQSRKLNTGAFLVAAWEKP